MFIIIVWSVENLHYRKFFRIIWSNFQLLCSNLIQNGEDDEGILGFLANDIRKEAKRISKRVCNY